MTSYIIAGASDNDLTTRCEFLSIEVKEGFPNIDFRVIIKDPKEWDNYIRDICRTYGFKNQENPIIFKSNGTLIGNARDFENYCEKNFGVTNIQNSRLKTDTTTNKKLAAKDFRLKQKQEKNKKTLTEKIIGKLEDSLRGGLIKMTEKFYVEVVNKGITFFIKQEKSLQPNIKVPLKITNPNLHLNEKEEDFNPEEAAKRDYPQELPIDPNALLEQKEGEPELKNEAKENEEKKEQVENPLVMDGATEVLEEDDCQEKKQQEELHEDEAIEEIEVCEEKIANEVCKCLDFPIGDFVVENIKDDYYLVLNPEPLINGQCLIIQDRRDIGIGLKLDVSKNDGNPSNVVYKEYSKTMRNRKNSRSSLNYEKERTGLYERFLNIYEPLSILDWSKMSKVIKKINAYAFVQILPFNCKNFSNFMNNNIHIIQRKFLTTAKNNSDFFSEEKEFYQLPFEIYWTSARQECRLKKKEKDAMFYKHENLIYNHLLAKLGENCGGKELHELYFDMMCYFKDVDNLDIENSGINIILSKDIMFLAPLQKPILKYNGVYDIFLPPFSYLGYIHRSTIKFVWPDTVHESTILDDPNKILEVLKKTGEK